MVSRVVIAWLFFIVSQKGRRRRGSVDPVNLYPIRRPNNTAPPFQSSGNSTITANVQKMSFSVSRYSVIQKYTIPEKKPGSVSPDLGQCRGTAGPAQDTRNRSAVMGGNREPLTGTAAPGRSMLCPSRGTRNTPQEPRGCPPARPKRGVVVADRQGKTWGIWGRVAESWKKQPL